MKLDCISGLLIARDRDITWGDKGVKCDMCANYYIGVICYLGVTYNRGITYGSGNTYIRDITYKIHITMVK